MDIRFTKRTAFLIVYDIVATFLSYLMASVLTGLVGEVFATHEIYFMLGVPAVVTLVMFAVFKLYNSLWEYASVDDVIRIVIAVGLSTLFAAVVLWMLGEWIPIRVYCVALVLMIIFAGCGRMVFRIIRSKKRVFAPSQPSEPRPRTLVVGAGETGSLAIDRMVSKDPLMPGTPIVAVDDNVEKRNLRIHGIRVAGTSDDILSLVERHDIEQIVVAIPSATLEERKRIYEICTRTNCMLRTLPNVKELRLDEINDVQLREVEVADLLGREEVVLNTRLVSGYIAGKVILVTGGGGSIGSELCRQVCAVAPKHVVIFDMYENDAYMLRNELLSQYSDIECTVEIGSVCECRQVCAVAPKHVVIFDMYENDAYMLRNELLSQYSDIECTVEIGSVCDESRLRDVFVKYHPAAVFHAAAHKHVPLMEICPREAIRNNVFGTLNTVRLADEFGVDRFIFISTDKAVNPTSVMGATKRMGEMIIQHYAQESKTVFTAVRFGNVLGSNGSVIPLFKRQIAAGGPVTVTHPDIERFFMTIPEASRLVIQAGGMAKGGEIFILDMGDPVKIVDLAKSLIQLSGLTLDKDIKIVFTGLREGEKMYEELLMNDENTLPTKMKGIMISTGKEVSYSEVESKLEALEDAVESDDETALHVLERVVPTYTITHNR